MKKSITYKDAGVDIDKAEGALNKLKDRIAATYTPEVLSGVGLFGSFYDISGNGLQHPVLVSSTDGVGTKLKVAIMADRHGTVGQDLVNHCIDDIAVCGAKPLFFLDYFASGKLEPHVYDSVVSGVAEGCKKAGIPLIGGETAEMPDFYSPGEYDMCGTIIGIVDKSKIIDGKKIQPGDALIGISGNGLHTNGYTLARKALFAEYSIDEPIAELSSATLADELLKIHPNYFPLISEITDKVAVHGISHITGGGIVGNTKRLLREGLSLEIDWEAWEIPAIFRIIQDAGNVPDADMRRAFNLGFGLVVIAKSEHAAAISESAKAFGFSATTIGKVTG
ncbi:MAG: phosphoribosylformylglycinamidine cyclo-ligase [Calditrichaeota bacterium]|nr:phosphoribosylformylglycinamidine cyclo-ligase [Calditrichota bacterium]